MARKKKTKKRIYTIGGYKSKYNIGGLKRRYQGGGMYSDNTVASAGQGVRGSTANIVFQESDPRLQDERIKAAEAEQERLRELSALTEEEVKLMEQESNLGIQQAAAESERKFAMGEAIASKGLDYTTKGLKAAGVIDKSVGTAGAPGSIGAGIKAWQMQRAANLAGKAQEGITAGVQTLKQVQQGERALRLAKKAGDTTSTIADLSTKAGTSALKSGWGSMSAAAKGNIIGTAATLAGEGLKRWGGDEDETELNTAEWSGELLSGAGTGIGVASTLGTIAGAVGLGATWGSAVPGLGTAIGAVAGLGYGAYKALAGRKKAREAEKEYEAKKAAKITDYNTKLRKRFGAQQARVRAGQLKQKTYSGYDLGRNVVAQMGGLRMGTPRYGYAV